MSTSLVYNTGPPGSAGGPDPWQKGSESSRKAAELRKKRASREYPQAAIDARSEGGSPCRR